MSSMTGRLWHLFTKKNTTDKRKTITLSDGSVETCEIKIVAFLNGSSDNKSGHEAWLWESGNLEAGGFAEALNRHMFNSTDNTELKKKKQSVVNIQTKKLDGNKLNKWFICFEVKHPEQIEIWLGEDSDATHGNGEPLYRLYPNPSREFSWFSFKKFCFPIAIMIRIMI